MMLSSWRSSYISFAVLMALIAGLYYPALYVMVHSWRDDQYNYCYLIPFVVLYLIWDKRAELASISSKPSWKGMVPFVFGIALYWVGELGGEYMTLYLSFWLVMVGLLWSQLGRKKLKNIGFALIFILTMFPLPDFLNTKLMLQLQLISSKLGVLLIQLFGLPVSRQGNIIDLGFAKLQVVEACSGLNSLISLSVLSLLVAYFFKAHLWKRCVVVLSSVPLAILTNSLRIAVTAILHKYFGPDIAQGFFHGFSGLVIFVINIPVLLIEMKIMEKLPPKARKSSPKYSDSEKQASSINPDPKGKKILQGATLGQRVFIVTVILLVATLAFSQGIEFREKIPAKKSLGQFPLKVKNWSAEGRQPLEKILLDALGLSEYFMADYQNRKGERISTYVAYYERQRKGKSIHTPASCLPASGWSIVQSGTVKISGFPGNPETMKVNRSVIIYGRSKQIAYYWFTLRGRILSNAYQVKIYNFWDALTIQRTDGALIRLITPVYEKESLSDAEDRLKNFVRDIVPVLNEYIPGRELHSSS